MPTTPRSHLMAIPEPFLDSAASITGSRQDRDHRRRRELEYGIRGIGDWMGEHRGVRGVESWKRGEEKRRQKVLAEEMGKERKEKKERNEGEEAYYYLDDDGSSSSAEIEPYCYDGLTRISSASSAEITYPRYHDNSPNTRHYEDGLGLQMAYTAIQDQLPQTKSRSRSLISTYTTIMAPPPASLPYRPDPSYSYLPQGSGSGSGSGSEWMSPAVRDRDTGVIFRPPPTPPETPEKPFSQSSAVTWGIDADDLGHPSRGQVGSGLDAAGEWYYSPLASDWWRR